mgnify:CR=1 FL=1
MRLPVLNPDQFTPRQKEVSAKHIERRNYLGGPYKVWIHSPDMFEKASAISNYMRFDCGLPVKLREFGILVMSRYWDAQYSWIAHVDKAIAAGVPQDVVDDLAHALDEQALMVLLEQRVPLAAPQHLDDVPARAPERRLELLHDLPIASNGPVEALQVAVDNEDQIVESLARR